MTLSNEDARLVIEIFDSWLDEYAAATPKTSKLATNLRNRLVAELGGGLRNLNWPPLTGEASS